MRNWILHIHLSILVLVLLPFLALSQYAPQVGNIGTTAIHKDSSIIKTFANYYPGAEGKNMRRGWLDISDTSLGKVSVGNIDSIANNPNFFMLSLGDGGVATFELPVAITNGMGPDFVIFENGFAFSSDSFFLELAFVEVSSDGQTFYRFPAYSETDTTKQIGPFGSIKAHKVHNLAGKYIMPYGVPFDLEDLKSELGSDQSIRFIRLIDVVGSINPMFASRDFTGKIINDPWPTPFPSGGFDLTGIGFIHGNFSSISELTHRFEPIIFPNPVASNGAIHFEANENIANIRISDLNGKIKSEIMGLNQNKYFLNENKCAPGIYFVELESVHGKVSRQKLIVIN